MTELQQKMTDVLEDTIQYYSEDPISRRNVSHNGKCLYSPIADSTEGCAIGRWCTPEVKKRLDTEAAKGNTSIRVIFYDQCYLFDLLPTELKELPINFLSELQRLHDSGSCWDQIGLTEKGQKQIDYIKSLIFNYE